MSSGLVSGPDSEPTHPQDVLPPSAAAQDFAVFDPRFQGEAVGAATVTTQPSPKRRSRRSHQMPPVITVVVGLVRIEAILTFVTVALSVLAIALAIRAQAQDPNSGIGAQSAGAGSPVLLALRGWLLLAVANGIARARVWAAITLGLLAALGLFVATAVARSEEFKAGVIGGALPAPWDNIVVIMLWVVPATYLAALTTPQAWRWFGSGLSRR